MTKVPDPLEVRFAETIRDCTDEELLALAFNSPAIHFSCFCRIHDKNNQVINPTPNILQLRMSAAYETMRAMGVKVRIIVTKPRRAGCSTFAAHILYHHGMKIPCEGIAIADKKEHSEALLKKLKSYQGADSYPWDVQMIADPMHSIEWSNGTKWNVDTAQNPNASVGDTNQLGLFSETSKWPQTTQRNDKVVMAAVLPTLSGSDSVGFSESTPEGAVGWQYSTWQEAVTLEEFIRMFEAGIRPEEQWVKVFAGWWEFADNARKQPVSEAEIASIKKTLTEHEQYEIEKYHLTWEQVAWRRDVIKSVCNGDPKIFSYYYPSDDVTCLSADNRVPTKRGMIPINEVVAGDVLSNGTAIRSFRSGPRIVGTMETKRGFRIECTHDHLIAMADGSFCKAEDTIGKRVRLSKPIFAETNHVQRWKGFAGASCSLEIDEQWGRFLGYFCGDGSLYKNQLSMVMDERDSDVVELMAKDWNELLGLDPIRRRPGSAHATELRVADQRITELFEELGILHDGPCGRKRLVAVPECIWRSPKPVVASFLNALYEADGHTRRTGRFVQFHSKHKRFCQDIIYLLLGLGVYGKLYSVVAKLNGKEHLGWCIRISAGYVDKFYSEIGFLGQRKQAFSTANKDSKSNGRKPEVLNDTDEVVSFVDSGTTVDVFDLTMSDDPEFCAGGIVVHNCWLASGSPRFDMGILVEMENRAKPVQPDTGYLLTQDSGVVTWQQTRDGTGDIWIWEYPIEHCRYLVTIDPATDESQTISADPDRHSVSVWRDSYHDADFDVWRPAKKVARLRPPFYGEGDEVAGHAARLSKMYGTCMTVIEINCGLDILRLLRENSIPCHKRRPLSHRTNEIVEQYGFRMTDKQERNAVIEGFAAAIRDRAIDVLCPHSIAEYKMFIRKPNGRAEAAAGAHDDDVLADAIAWQTMPSATAYKLTRVKNIDPPDMAKRGKRGGWREVNNVRRGW